jgi:hypothetical protein
MTKFHRRNFETGYPESLENTMSVKHQFNFVGRLDFVRGPTSGGDATMRFLQSYHWDMWLNKLTSPTVLRCIRYFTGITR